MYVWKKLPVTFPVAGRRADGAHHAHVEAVRHRTERHAGRRCETQVLDGVPDHRDSVLSEIERRANDCMMICVSRSCTPRLVLDL